MVVSAPPPKTELCGPFDTPRRSVGALRTSGSCDCGPTPNRTSTTATPAHLGRAPSFSRTRESMARRGRTGRHQSSWCMIGVSHAPTWISTIGHAPRSCGETTSRPSARRSTSRCERSPPNPRLSTRPARFGVPAGTATSTRCVPAALRDPGRYVGLDRVPAGHRFPGLHSRRRAAGGRDCHLRRRADGGTRGGRGTNRIC